MQNKKRRRKINRVLAMFLAVFVLMSFSACKSDSDPAQDANVEVSRTPHTSQAENSQTGTEKNEEEKTTDGKNEKDKEETTQGQPQKVDTLGSVAIVGKAAYEYYNFVKATADRYAAAVSRTADKLDDVNIYDVIVPTSIDIMLDEATRNNMNSQDQKKAIAYISSIMSKNVKCVEIFDALKAHNDEYIYFRTDHHWTQLGAYYAYCELAKAAKYVPVDIKDFEKVSYGKFLGSFYSDTGKNPKLEKNADELIAYKPDYSTALKYKDRKGNTYDWPLINDVSTYNTAYKYSAFIGGDNPYATIKNNDIKNGKTAIVVKESFANAMLPFIAGNYKKVYVIDYRYWDGKLTEFAGEKKVDDIIFINNISATRNAALITDLENII